MTIIEALEIVLELAIENELEDFGLTEILKEHYDDQQEAFEAVQNYIDYLKQHSLYIKKQPK